MTKTIKISTMEKRFKKLHDTASFAEDYAKAIGTHVQMLMHDGQTDKKVDVTLNMVEQLDDWSEKFPPLIAEMKRVEGLYYVTAKDDMAELIEEIPSMDGYTTHESYKMTEELCKIGYIEIEGDPYLTSEKNYTDEEIVKNVQDLHFNLILCIKALTSATYQGIWNEVAKKAIDIHDTIPNGAITQFLIAFGVDFGEGKE